MGCKNEKNQEGRVGGFLNAKVQKCKKLKKMGEPLWAQATEVGPFPPTNHRLLYLASV